MAPKSRCLYAALSGVQCPGVLDDLFFYEGPLGACPGSDSVSISLWAPTAQQVTICRLSGNLHDLNSSINIVPYMKYSPCFRVRPAGSAQNHLCLLGGVPREVCQILTGANLVDSLSRSDVDAKTLMNSTCLSTEVPVQCCLCLHKAQS